MKKMGMTALVVAPLAIGRFGHAQAQRQAKELEPITAVGYICPLTGEELPCPNCCPLNQQK